MNSSLLRRELLRQLGSGDNRILRLSHRPSLVSDRHRAPFVCLIDWHNGHSEALALDRNRQPKSDRHHRMRILVTQDQDCLRPQVEAGVTCPLGRIVLLGDGQHHLPAHDVSLHLTEQLVNALLTGLGKREDPLAYLAVELRAGGGGRSLCSPPHSQEMSDQDSVLRVVPVVGAHPFTGIVADSPAQSLVRDSDQR